MKKRAHIHYTGHVQGVGFRFTAEYIARELFLTGWVKNLTDGRVEVVCEGEEMTIKKFLKQLSDRMKRYTKYKDVDWQDYKGEFQDFGIRFY